MGPPLSVGQLSLRLRRIPKKFKPKSLEKDVERAICDYLRVRGLFFWKQTQSGFYDVSKGFFRKQVSPYVRNGVPDILMVIKGRLFGLEVKSEKGVQSEAQKDFERDLLNAGGVYRIVRSIDDVEGVLNGI